MGFTPDEYAIKLTAEISGVRKSLADVRADIQATYGTLTDSQVKSAQQFQEAIDKQYENAQKKIEQNLKKELAQKNESLKQQLTAEKLSAEKTTEIKKKHLDETSAAIKKAEKESIDSIEKIYAVAGKPPKSLPKGGFADAFKINISDVNKNLEAISDLQRDFASKDKKIQLALQSSFKDFRSTDQEIAEKGAKNIENILNGAHGRNLIEAHKYYEKARELAAGNEKLLAQIEKDKNDKIEKLEMDHNLRMERLQKAAVAQEKANAELHAKFEETGALKAGGKIFTKHGEEGEHGGGAGVFGKAKEQISEHANEHVEEFGKEMEHASGGVGKFVSNLGGIGTAVAVGIGAVKELGEAVFESAEKYDHYQKALNIMEQQTGLSSDAVKQLGADLQSIERPAEMSAKDVLGIATSVQKFTKDASKIPEVTSKIIEMSLAFPNADPKELAASVNRMTKQLGDADKAMDVLAASAKAFRMPIQDVGDSLEKIFVRAGVAIGDSTKAMEESQQVFKAFLSTGMTSEAAAASAEKTFAMLNKQLAKPDTIDKVNKSLAGTGKTLADIGLEVGNVDIGKLVKTLQQGGPLASGLTADLGKATQSLQILTTSFERTGKSMDDFKVKNEGASEGLKSLETPMEKAEAALKQNWDNIWLNIGRTANEGVSGIAEIAAEGLGAISEYFEPAIMGASKLKKEYDELRETTLQLGGASDDINAILEKQVNAEGELSEVGADHAMEILNEKMKDVQKTAPDLAASIKKIMDEKGGLTAKSLEKINELLKEAGTLSENLQLSKSLELAEKSSEVAKEALQKFGDTAKAQLGFFERNLMSVGKAFGLGFASTNADMAFDLAKRSLAEINAEYDKQKKNRDELIEKKQSGQHLDESEVEELTNANSKLGELAEKRSKVNAEQAEAQKALNDQAKTQMDLLVQSHDIDTLNLSQQEIKQRLVDQLTKSMGDGEDVTNATKDAISASVDEQMKQLEASKQAEEIAQLTKGTSEENLQIQQEKVDSQYESLDAQKEGLAQQKESGAISQEEYDAQMQTLTAQESQVQAIGDAIALKTNALDIDKAVNDAMNAQLEAQFGITNANAATVDQKISALEATKDQILADKDSAEVLLTKLEAAAAGTENLNSLTAEAATLASKYASNMSQGKIGVEVATANVHNIISNLKASIANMDKSVGAIDKQIGVLKARTPPEGKEGKGGGKSGEKTETNKVLEGFLKSIEDYNKGIQKANEDYKKAMAAIDEQQKNEDSKKRIEEFNTKDALHKAMFDRIQAEREMADSIKKFSDEMDKMVKEFSKTEVEKIKSLVSDLLTPLEEMGEQFKQIEMIQFDAIKSQNEKIKELTDSSAKLQAQYDSTTKELKDNQIAMEQAKTALNGLKASMDVAKKALPEAERTETDTLLKLQERDKMADERAKELKKTTDTLALFKETLDHNGKITQGQINAFTTEFARALKTINTAEYAITSGNKINYDLSTKITPKNISESIRSIRETISPYTTKSDQYVDKTKSTRIDSNIKELDRQINQESDAYQKYKTHVEEYQKSQQGLSDQLKTAQKNIEDANGALLKLQKNEDAQLAKNVAILKPIYEQQKKIYDLERDRAHQTDLFTAAAQDNKIEREKEYYNQLLEANGLNKESLETLIQTVAEQGAQIVGVTDLTDKLMAGPVENYQLIQSIVEAITRDTNEISKLQGKFGENLAVNANLYGEIATKLSEQQALIETEIALKESDLKTLELTEEQYNKINDEVVQLKNNLKGVKQQQLDNGKAAMENANKQMARVMDTMKEIQSSFHESDSGKSIGNAFLQMANGMKELEKATPDMDAAMKNFAVGATAVLNVVANIDTEIDSFKQAIAQKGVGGGITQVGDIMEKVGEALLQAPYPINIVGAMILGVGLITELIGKIYTAIVGRQQTALEIEQARDRAATQMNEQYKSQVDAMNILVELGAKDLQNAEQKIKYLKDQHDLLVLNNDEAAAFAQMSDEELVNTKTSLEDRKASRTRDVQDAEALKGRSRDAQQAFLESHGIAVHWYENTQDLLDSFVESNNAIIDGEERKLGEISTEIDYRKTINGLSKEQEDSLSSQLDLIERIALHQNKYSKALDASLGKLNEARGAANQYLMNDLGYNTTGMSNDQLANMLLKLTQSDWDQFTKEGRDAVSKWLDDWDSATTAAAQDEATLWGARKDNALAQDDLDIAIAKRNKESTEQIAALEKKKRQDEAEWDKQRMDEITHELDELEKIGGTEEQRLALQTEFLGLEKSYNELLTDDNSQLDKQNATLTKMVRERQKLIDQARAGTASYADVAKQTQNIVGELQKEGWTQEDIAKFMATLPKYEKGGSVDEGPAMLHDNEFVMSRKAVEAYGVHFMNMLNNLQTPSLDSYAMRSLSQSIMKQQIMNTTQNNSSQNILVTINATITSNDAKGVKAELEKLTEKAIVDMVNKNIYTRNINILNGGRV